MSHLSTYRVVSPFLAITAVEQGPRFFRIPEGAVLETEKDLFQPGLVEVKIDHQTLLAFTRDIKERAVPLNPEPAEEPLDTLF